MDLPFPINFSAGIEGLHTDFACLLYSHIVNKLRQEEIYAITSEAIAIEKRFITESLPVELIGMNCRLISQYIEFIADRLVFELGCEKCLGWKILLSGWK